MAIFRPYKPRRRRRKEEEETQCQPRVRRKRESVAVLPTPSTVAALRSVVTPRTSASATGPSPTPLVPPRPASLSNVGSFQQAPSPQEDPEVTMWRVVFSPLAVLVEYGVLSESSKDDKTLTPPPVCPPRTHSPTIPPWGMLQKVMVMDCCNKCKKPRAHFNVLSH